LRFHSARQNAIPSVLTTREKEFAMGGVVIASVGSAWNTAFETFKGVFEEKTGLAWVERLEKARAGMKVPGTEGDEKFFKYAMPKEDEPRGLMPPIQRLKAECPLYSGGATAGNGSTIGSHKVDTASS
jgi:hypothetical protein